MVKVVAASVVAGVPASAPVDESKVTPAGRVPPEMLYAVGVPPVLTGVNPVNGLPTVTESLALLNVNTGTASKLKT